MKKVKIMLLSLALFAIVGGALAFKAKYTTRYCTTNTIDDGAGNPICPDAAVGLACPLFVGTTTSPIHGVRMCTTNEPIPNQGCTGVTTCTFLNTFKNDN